MYLVGAVDVGSLTASAGTIIFEAGAEVTAANSVSLTSVNSLTFAKTGVPYLGSVTLNDGPPPGQPFALDPYITGPDWGTYGYAPGDTITIANAGTLPSKPASPAVGYTVDAIVGNNLYLDSSVHAAVAAANGANTSGTFSDVTVQCSGFTPEIQSPSVTLNVTGAGSTISGAISSGAALTGAGQVGNFVLLNASTDGGNITIQDLPPTSTSLVLGTLNAGTGTIQLAVNGSVYSGAFLNYVFLSLRLITPTVRTRTSST